MLPYFENLIIAKMTAKNAITKHPIIIQRGRFIGRGDKHYALRSSGFFTVNPEIVVITTPMDAIYPAMIDRKDKSNVVSVLMFKLAKVALIEAGTAIKASPVPVNHLPKVLILLKKAGDSFVQRSENSDKKLIVV